jgi:serine-type D-Ala-D-Ala carboxypeptidase/endopeptidase
VGLCLFHPLLWPPATIAAYSNVGFQLLGEALAAATGEDYAALLRSRLAEPLGLSDTTLRPTPDQCVRLMTGSGLTGPAPCIDTGLIGANAGVYSTGNDMAKWLRHLVNRPTAAAPARLMARAAYRQRAEMPAAIAFDEAGPMSGLGLGWVIEAPRDTMPLLVQDRLARGLHELCGVRTRQGGRRFLRHEPGRSRHLSTTITVANGILAAMVAR